MKTALITGASSGIGKALAHEFARDGYRVVLIARSAAQLEALAQELKTAYSVQAIAIASDLSAANASEQLFNALQAQQIKIHTLINNAGYGLYGEFSDADLGKNLNMMQLNMNALVSLTHYFLPSIMAEKGQIMNVASTASFQPGPYMAVYYASKSFVLSFSEAIAEELASKGVTVMALCPGRTASGFQDRAVMADSALVKGKKLPTAEAVAAAAYAALKRGKRVYIPGVMNWLLAQSIRFTPRRVVTWLVKSMSKPV